jgi:Kunitz/Bovine pancreatic trypsin inhibitor domain
VKKNVCTKPNEKPKPCRLCTGGMACPAVCKFECICEDGYIRNDNGDCIKKQPPCEQEIVVGPCKGAIPKWAYDKNKKKCVQFSYGGCEGNDNNYDTKDQCEKACPCSNDDDEKCGLNEHYEDCNSCESCLIQINFF